MTLGHTLARDGHRTRKITTTAHATFGVADHVQVIRRSELEVVVDVDGLDESRLNGRDRRTLLSLSNTLRAGGVELDVAARLLALHT
jgi:uncharacterized protein YbgA (DUF1722 family)